MREVVIIAGARTAIGDYMGSLSGLTPVQLGIIALKGALAKAGIDGNLIQEVICGQCNQAGAPGNTARHIALGAELPAESFAFTVHQQCASSMRGSELLSQEIMLGKIDIGAAGARLVITMINELKRRGKKFGCASLCASGGPAHAFILEVL